ncbi:MAG: hypothetical protein HFH60_10315 [Lachnospiraceae bacterium]|nr:hypothetical protein [Lachnospiraceae bacterium]
MWKIKKNKIEAETTTELLFFVPFKKSLAAKFIVVGAEILCIIGTNQQKKKGSRFCLQNFHAFMVLIF